MAGKAGKQRGGFFLGTIVGLLIGLVLALGVALYVTKVPIPFVDKVPQRTADQDAAEAAKNRNWDPNAGLAGAPASGPAPAASAAAATAAEPTRPAASAAAEAPRTAASAAKAGEGMQFFVQVGAYARTEDAEQQRAKLGMGGLIGRISEREQGGKLVYRVRLGPFDTREEADVVREQAVAAGFPDATLVRVPPAQAAAN